MDFNIYLSNLNSIEKYIENTPSKFTNDIIPPIQLNPPTEWEVALKSCLLPFQGYNSKFLTDKKIYQLAWVVTEKKPTGNEIIKATYKVSLGISQILESKPEIILKKIIAESELASRKDFFTSILNVYQGYLILTGRYNTTPKSMGSFKNIISIVLVMNSNVQSLFGLDSSNYSLYKVNPDVDNLAPSSRNIMKLFTGNKKIGVELTPSPHIKIYTDIIKPVNYGTQNLQLLDILPFGSSKNIERKVNELCYRSLNSNDIKSISIIIHDSANNILENYTENMILSLHFRKKSI